LHSIEEELEMANAEAIDDKDRNDWNETAVVVLNGISDLLATYLDVLAKHQSFNSLWRELVDHLTRLLDFKVLNINTATFKALTKILSRRNANGRHVFNKETLDLAWELWARGIPLSTGDSKTSDNQNCLTAYVSALHDIYRLIYSDLTVERIQRMLTLLREALQVASVGNYVADIEYSTQLQNQVLEAIKMVRTDLAGVPAVMISQVAEFVSLAFHPDITKSQAGTAKRTYVAMSKASMSILQVLILRNSSDPDIYTTGAFSASLNALAKPIALKYSFPIVTKSAQPWKLATTSTLAILESTLPQIRVLDIPKPTIQGIWQTIVAIADGIVCADCNAAPDGANIGEDQSFDIDSFSKLRELIIPALGSDSILDKTRKAYAESLFRTSIIHPPSLAEGKVIYGNNGADGAGLGALYKPRKGRTVDPAPTRREKMSYVCLNELFALVAVYDADAGPKIVIQPPTPKIPPPQSASLQEAPHALHIRIARTAAPYLILRAALSMRAYIADQPLRGRIPQPISQRKELIRILSLLVDLKSEPDSIPDTPNVESESRKHLLRLYPLLVAALQVAGTASDEAVLKLMGKALEVVGVELGV
jgi:hypothetical protein